MVVRFTFSSREIRTQTSPIEKARRMNKNQSGCAAIRVLIIRWIYCTKHQPKSENRTTLEYQVWILRRRPSIDMIYNACDP